MPFPTTLDNTQISLVRNESAAATAYAADQYLLLGSNTVVLACRVNQATFGDSFVQFTYDGATGDYTDVEAGMVVLISHVNDKRKAFFTGRVREVPTSTVLKINETSAGIQDDDYVWVLRDYRLHPKLGRDTGTAYFKDYNQTFSQPLPLIYNLQSAYAAVCDENDECSFTFEPEALAVASGATISSWLWTLPDGVTTSDELSSQSITVTCEASPSEYWLKVSVTDSGGRTQVRRFPVWAVPRDLSGAVYLGFDGASVEGDLDNGWSASVKAFARVEEVLDNTLCCVLDVERYGDEQTSILSNIRFVGRLRTESNRSQADETYGLLKETDYTIEGVGAQLANCPAPSIYMREKASPTVWDEIKQLTLWRGMWYLLFHSTFHELHSLSFQETGDSYRLPTLEAQGQNLLDVVSDLADSLNAVLEFAPSGELRIHRNLNYTNEDTRSAADVVMHFTETDWLGFTLEHGHVAEIGAVSGDGGSYNPANGQVYALIGNAPKVAQDDAQGTSNLSRQVLATGLSKAAAKAELSQRLGDHLAYVNPTDMLTVDFPDGYTFLVPSASQWYTFTIAASENTGGRAYTTADRWILQSVSLQHDNATGTKRVQGVFRLETQGVPGIAFEPPAPAQIPPYIPSIPTIPPFPSLGTPPDVWQPPNPTPENSPPPITDPSAWASIPANGNAVFLGTATGAWTTTSFIGIPIYNEVTPDITGTIRAGCLGIAREAYLLESDGTNSWVWYTEDVFASEPDWTVTEISGVFTAIELGSTAGEIYIKSEGSGPWSQTFDFTLNDGDFQVRTTGGNNNGTYVPETGWQHTDHVNEVSNPDAGSRAVLIECNFPSAKITHVSFTYNLTKGTYDDGTFNGASIILNDTQVAAASFNSLSSGDDQSLEWDGSLSGINEIAVFLRSSRDTTSPYSYSGSALITSVTVEGEGANPFGSAGSARTAYSSDHGANFESPETIGASVGAFGGIDAIKIGTVILAGASGQVKIAESGGEYEDYGDPMPEGATPACLVVPRCQFGSTTVGNTGSSPQYLVAAPGLTASNEAVWKVTDGGTTFTDITPLISGDYGYATGPDCLAMPWWSGSRIAAVLQFGSLPRLVTSANAGASWTNRGVLSEGAKFITFRKGDKTMKQLFLLDGQPVYSPAFGASLIYKPHPSPAGKDDDPCVFISVFG